MPRLGVPISAPNLMTSASKTIFFNIGVWNCPLHLCKFFQDQEKEKIYIWHCLTFCKITRKFMSRCFSWNFDIRQMDIWERRPKVKGQWVLITNQPTDICHNMLFGGLTSLSAFLVYVYNFYGHFDLPLTVWYVIINFIMWPTGIFCMRNWRWQGRAGW